MFSFAFAKTHSLRTGPLERTSFINFSAFDKTDPVEDTPDNNTSISMSYSPIQLNPFSSSSSNAIGFPSGAKLDLICAIILILGSSFINWTNKLTSNSKVRIIAIDGKHQEDLMIVKRELFI